MAIMIFNPVSNSSHHPLEPVCCKKQQKKVPNQLLVFGIEDLNFSKLIVYDPNGSLDLPGSNLYHSESSEVPYSINK
jgi:hypothetical protein